MNFLCKLEGDGMCDVKGVEFLEPSHVTAVEVELLGK